MKIRFMRRLALALGLILGVAQIPLGCDSGTGDDSELDNYFANHPYVSDPRDGGATVLTVTPASAEVTSAGGRAVFSVNGGTDPYTWDVADSSKGSISGSGGQGVYTAIAVGNNDVIVYDRNGNAAIARITGSATDEGGPLAISADPTTLEPDLSKAVITASGGIPPYSWTVDSPKGYLDVYTGSSVVYTRTTGSGGSGDNAVTVTDSTGARASVVLKQP